MISRPAAYRILVAPIGDIDPALCDAVRCAIESIYGLPGEVQTLDARGK